MTRSVPEKTLEHWASQYIAYRYRPAVSLWWPAKGEDIQIDQLPMWPGKAIQFELKTTEVRREGVHEVKVDLGQLWEYYLRRPGRQPFYVFPYPDTREWPGDLRLAAAAAGYTAPELGFSRSKKWWFANRMVVLTTGQVAKVLERPLRANAVALRGRWADDGRLLRWSGGLRPVAVIGSFEPEVRHLAFDDPGLAA